MRASRRPQPHSINTQFQCQLSHVTAGHAFLLAVCIILLPMLVVTAEHAQMVTTDCMNSMDQLCIPPRCTSFKHARLMLPPLNNILPAMALQNEIVKSNIWCLSRSSSHASVRHVSFSPGFNVPSGLRKMVVGAVVVLLLLMSGDIEVNPGPVGNKLTVNDLICVMEEILDVSADWYDLGLQLKLSIGTLKSIRAEFSAPKHQLRETLNAWLSTGDNPSWKTLTDALRSRMVGASQLAAALETKYCPVEGTELDIGGHPETVFPSSPVLPTVMSQQTNMQESMRTSPCPHSSPKHAPPELQTVAVSKHPSLSYQHMQGPQYIPELNVFDLYFDKLVESIHPERLAFELYSQEMISTQVRDETMKFTGPSTYDRASKLVVAVKEQIVVNPSVFHKFLSVVRRNASLVYIADAMSDSYRSLLPPKCAGTSLPTLSQLSAELRDFKNWYLLGLQLNLSTDTLDSIEKAHDGVDRQCIKMVQHWISSSNSPTWGDVHKALRNIGESVIAAEIASKYNIPPSITREEKLPAQTSEHSSSKSDGMSGSSNTIKALKPTRIIFQEQRRIVSYFATVLDKITEMIETVVELKKLLRFLRFYGHPLNPEMRYIDQQILQSTSSVSEVMESLFPDYINYMNTGLLEDIIERFECKEAQSLLQQYHDRYPLNRLLRDMPDPVSDERLDLTQRKRLRVERDGDFDSARALDIKRIRTAIEDATGIDHQFVNHAQHSPGSLKLIFLIPESVAGIFQELCDEDLEILAEAGIVELQIDDFMISDIQNYCPQRTDNSTQSVTALSADQSGTAAKGFDTYINQRADFTSKEKGQLKGLLNSIPRSRMEEVCSDSFLQQLATQMRDWRELAPHFGITQHEAEVLTFNYPDVGEQRYRALHCWKQINPDNATYKELLTCLLTHGPFDLAEAALKMISPDAVVQETRKLLHKAYLSEESRPLWTGAPELLQFDRRLGRVTKDTDERLRDIDYSSWFETLEHFSSEIETVSIKSFVNTVAKKKDRFFLIKGPPSSGRTVLLRRVCASWVQGFCLRKFTLVLWLDLKAHPSAPSHVSLRTLLSYSLPQGSDLDSIQQWLERHSTQDVLIVVDGVEGQAYNERKPFLELLARIKASVILTATSPIQIKDPTWATWYVVRYMNLCQYDILGLSQDQISKQVIHHYHHDPSSAEEFLTYISEAHDIRALCSSPPYLAVVLFVFDSVSTTDLPNTWTQLFSSLKNSLFRLSSVSESVDTNLRKLTKLFFRLKHSLFRQSSVPDHGTLTILASKAYMMTITNSTYDLDNDYINFCSRVIPPYHTMISTAEHCYFTLPLLQHYLCAQHIHSLPHRQHVSALNEKTVPLHVRRFYVGLCSSSKRAKVILGQKDTFMCAACESEVVINSLQKIMTSELTFKNQLLTSLDIHHIFQAVHYSGLMCKLEFRQCLFGSMTFEMMGKWLRGYSILLNGGVIQKLSLSGNQISNIGARELARALQVTHSLQELDLGYNKISDEGARGLSAALQVNQSLQELNLRDNKISAKGVCALVRVFQVNQSLQKLKLSGLSKDEITDEHVCALVRELQVNQSHQKLDLSKKGITDEGACALSAALQVNQSLQELNLGSNQITAEGAHAVAAALQVNQSLQELNLGSNQISDEGVHGFGEALRVNQSLQELNLSRNKITSDGVRELAGALLADQTLRELNLGSNQISDEGAHAVAAALQVNQSLQELNLSDNKISADGVLVLAGSLIVNRSLKLNLNDNGISGECVCVLVEAVQVNQNHQMLELNLSGNKITDEGACAIATALRVNKSLQRLNLGYNQISDGVCALSEALRVNQTLKELNLEYNQISDEGVHAVATALQVNQSLQELNLRGNKISAKGVCAVVRVFQVNQSLQKLKLSGLSKGEITDERVCALFRELQVNQSHQKLDLSNKGITDKGACALSAALQVNQSLQELNLGRNRIKDEGVRAFSEALRVNQSLQKLNLSWNQIKEEAVCALSEALRMNQSLQELNLGYNQISDEGASTVAAALQVNQSLQELDLSGNRIKDEGVRALSEALRVNQSLQKLNLGYNQISDEGANTVAAALQVNQSLQELDLSGNRIKDEGVRALSEALRVNQSIQKLNLWYNQITDEEASTVAAALEVNQSLRKLDLRDNKISAEGVCALVRVFQVNQSLQKLKLSGLSEDKITDERVCALVRELQVNQSHQKLDLSNKGITDQGACALSAALQVNKSLQELNLRDNKISAEGVCALVRVFQVNQSLQKLKLSGLSEDEITDERVCALVRELQVNQSHQKLDFSENWIKYEGVRALSEALRVNQSLQELNLSRNQIKDEGVRALSEALRGNQSLQKLNLGYNQISDEGASTVAAALQVNQSLQELDLSWNQIKAEGVHALSEALRGNQNLQKLNLSGNQIKEGVSALSEALRVNQSLQKLNLRSNQITGEGASTLAAALQVNQSLQKLNLRWNQIEDEGVRALSEALRANQSLQKLNLSENHINNEGVCALSEALRVNQSLQKLNLRNKKISAEGVCALVRVFQVNQSLQKLKLSGLSKDKITDEHVCALVRELQVNQSHQKLDLSNKGITDLGVCALSAALQVNQSLQKLNLSWNQIKDEEVRALSEALRVNQSLQKLNLSWNQIKDEGVCALSEALRVNQNLQKLNVGWNYISSRGCSALREAQRKRKNLNIEGLDWQRH